MTTSWAHFVHGNWIVAWRTSAGGTLLAASTCLAAPWLLGSACAGRWMGLRPSDLGTLAYCSAILGVTLLDWILRIIPAFGS
jgi:hypothetical protein